MQGYQNNLTLAANAAARAAQAQAVLNTAQRMGAVAAPVAAQATAALNNSLRQQARALLANRKIMQEASTAVLGLGASMSGLGQAMYPVFFALYNSPPQIQFAAAAFLALTGVLKATNEAFVETERTYTRLSLALSNSGLSIAARDLKEYARARSDATGIDENATLRLIEQLVNLRATEDQLRRLVPLIQGAAIAGHGTGGSAGGPVDATQVATNLVKAVESGETAALTNLGLDADKIKRSANRVEEIINQMTIKFGDNVELMTNTLVQQQERVNVKWKNLLTDLGGLFAPLQRLWATLKGLFFDALRGAVLVTRKLLELITFGMLDFRGEQAANAIAEKTNAYQRDSLRHLRSIDQNTQQFTTTMARAILGGTGRRVSEAATIRNFTTLSRNAF